MEVSPSEGGASGHSAKRRMVEAFSRDVSKEGGEGGKPRGMPACTQLWKGYGVGLAGVGGLVS